MYSEIQSDAHSEILPEKKRHVNWRTLKKFGLTVTTTAYLLPFSRSIYLTHFSYGAQIEKHVAYLPYTIG